VGGAVHSGHPSAKECLVFEEVQMLLAFPHRVVHRAGRSVPTLVRRGEPSAASEVESDLKHTEPLLKSTAITCHGDASPTAAPNILNISGSPTSSIFSSAAPTVCRTQVRG